MITEADIDREFAELDQFIKNLPTVQTEENPSEAEISEMMVGFEKLALEKAKFVMPEETRIALQQIELRQDRAELRRQLRMAESLAKRIDVAEAVSFIQNALLSIPDETP